MQHTIGDWDSRQWRAHVGVALQSLPPPLPNVEDAEQRVCVRGGNRYLDKAETRRQFRKELNAVAAIALLQPDDDQLMRRVGRSRQGDKAMGGSEILKYQRIAAKRNREKTKARWKKNGNETYRFAIR
jgi:hypothetical protein